jgi:hypothetical protein
VLAFSDIIDYLLRLLGDDDARARFERDPQAALSEAGLEGVTGQDIRDARLQLADSGAMCAVDDGRHDTHPGGHDPVREIGYTTAHYTATEHVRHDAAPADHASTPTTNTFLTIDDRDTLLFQSIQDDDLTLTDNSVTVTDAFNTDNSSVTAIQANGSSDLFNSDDDVVAIQDNDVGPGGDPITVDTAAPEAVDAPAGGTDPEVEPTDPAPPAVEDDLPDAVPADDPPEVDEPAPDATDVPG